MAGKFSVVDLFSGGGGMSSGFKAHGCFEIVAAADAEMHKGSGGRSGCNDTYERNIGLRPVAADLALAGEGDIRGILGIGGRAVDVLAVCPPCTGFSRANHLNHIRDDARNSLVAKAAGMAAALGARVVVMENVREMLRGNFRHHFDAFRRRLEAEGYAVSGQVHMLDRFGLPQSRERALVVAARDGIRPRGLDEMWDGRRVAPAATTVRRALEVAAGDESCDRRVPGFAAELVRRRMDAIPRDGGSWMDLLGHPDADKLMTGSMKRIAAAGKFGSYPDVYGRMAWDRPALTIKRECAHVGNGRYAHPEENRLLTVGEMAVVGGFPSSYDFGAASVANAYRHVGDAVPPMISFQLAHLCHWMLDGARPDVRDAVMPGTSLRRGDIEPENMLDMIRPAS